MDEAMEKRWRELSEEVLNGMKEWRIAHPKATFREIEDAVHERMSRLEAQLVQETTLVSELTDWQQAPAAERPTCPNCGTPLVSRGKRQRELQSRGGQTIKVKRTRCEPVPTVGWVFFPLDEQLALIPGSLTPKQEEHLVHLATWMPFARAGQMLQQLTGVFVSEATIRRHTEQAGQCSEEVQNAQSQQTIPQTSIPEQVVMSADGAFVPLVGGVWAEVRTMAIGEVQQKGDQTCTRQVSYFSRMTDATTFGELVEGEMERRQVPQAKQVAAVIDGAPWLQEVVDLYRTDAVRILDFPHAAQRIGAILETVQQAGHALPFDALSRCLHLLKHCGPRPVLRWLRHLTRSLLEVGKIREDLAYLHKREALMQYPRYRDAGWPIGSGMVESANKLVMQARLKGPGMHWAGPHVNPMLSLRNAVCNDLWDEAWEQASSACLEHLRNARLSQTQERQQEATQRFVLAWMRFLLPRSVPHSPQLPSQPARMVAGRPTAHHPWRRPWVPRSSTVASAKI